MANDGSILRDSEGRIRFASPLKATEIEAKEVIEAVYVKTGLNLGFKQLGFFSRFGIRFKDNHLAFGEDGNPLFGLKESVSV